MCSNPNHRPLCCFPATAAAAAVDYAAYLSLIEQNMYHITVTCVHSGLSSFVGVMLV